MESKKAYLQTEGEVDYRDCKVCYYTYTMFETPNKFRVSVNLHSQSPQGEHVVSLALSQEFATETEAINFAIAQGKLNIDKYYAEDKIKKLVTKSPANKIISNKNQPVNKAARK